ncbi:glycosyltransferase [Microbacterium sp. zg.B48]|uniref:glycosyltransferase n=1 Tax=Microbacterium sp. zg.B48 TaxID=2969408 RepID=UPI00214B4A2F|nr:glycosyltransferase [Microbacterium sp. zg.B48]MCR2764232.1 glycosyltransferase [Microbacterium sp. zg.B48]
MTSRVIHVIPELRAAHVQRLGRWAPDDVVLYRKLKWDMTRQPDASQATKLTVASLWHALRATRHVVVELPEPLWMRELGFTTSVALAVRLMKGRRARLVAYCIENNETTALVGYRGRLQSLVSALVLKIVGATYSRILDGLVFGSPGSMTTYANIPRMLNVEHELILELPAPSPPLVTRDTDGALFVGTLDNRKGVAELLPAWAAAESTMSANITIVGDGPLAADVALWTSERPERRTYLPHVDHELMVEIYRTHRVLIAPSIRDGRWREQIGLPIKEALSHGLTIVTTTETGLSGWLSANGHTTISAASDLETAICASLAAPLDPSVVAASLPSRDGRQRADDWMRRR